MKHPEEEKKNRRGRWHRPNERTDVITVNAGEENLPADPFIMPEPQRVVTEERYDRLTATLACMLGAFALFLVFAEKKNRYVRHYALQCVSMILMFLAGNGLVMALGGVFSMIGSAQLLLRGLTWVMYVVVLVLTVLGRVDLMLHAWQGRITVAPLIGWELRKLL